MSNYTTTDDLATDALQRAGEQTDGSSDWATLVYQYLNAVQLGLLLGGPFGNKLQNVTFPIIDWWWARKSPRGVFNTVAEITTGTVSVTQGSTTLTFSSGPSASVQGYRIRVNGLQEVPRIASHTAGSTTATMDVEWQEADQTAVTYSLFKIEYALASDFLRPCGQLVIPTWPYKIDIVDQNAMEDMFPIGRVSPGSPSLGCMIDPQTIQLNVYTLTIVRVEYPYIYLPSDLATGGTPILPRHHRRILSTYAAALICFDKSDNKFDALILEGGSILASMVAEQQLFLRKGSQFFAQILPRQGQRAQWYRPGPIRTESGLIIG